MTETTERTEAEAVPRGARSDAQVWPFPARVQRRRTRGWRMPPGAVYVGRPSRWGNPFPVTEHGRPVAVAHFRAHVLADPVLLAAVRAELAGRPLACWCPLDLACHADVLLDLANTPDSTTGHHR